MDNKQKHVYNILMMPISCESHSGFSEKRKIDIKREGNLIITSQTYWPQYKDRDTGELFRYDFKSDCDMSDFACGFYEIIYKDMLEGRTIVDDVGNFTKKEYAGDTMTSVSKLLQLKDKYHCLANFWLLPMKLGRTSENEWCKTFRGTDTEDFMDRFLLLIKDNFERYKESYPNYFQGVKGFETFTDIHFLKGSYIDSEYGVNKYSLIEDDCTADKVFKFIKNRADVISKSVYCNELWNYFVKWGLVEDGENH